MKVVIQNGCDHALTRRQVEAMVDLFSDSWEKSVKTITLYQGKESEITTEYYKKEQVLGLFSPRNAKIPEAKTQAVQEMLIVLECIAEHAELPKYIGKSARTDLAQRTSPIRARCHLLIGDDAT